MTDMTPRKPKVERELSLLERAMLFQPGPVAPAITLAPAPASEPARVDPAPAAIVPAAMPVAEPAPVAVDAPPTLPSPVVDARPVAIEVIPHESPAVAPNVTTPEPASDAADDTLSAIPAEFLARTDGSGADDDFTPPPVIDGEVRIDRGLLAEAGLIVPGAPIGPLAEEFRLVKRQLFVTKAKLEGEGGGDPDQLRARTLLVCSARPGDGKTFCATNLALSIAAERDIEVLLIDADVAKPDVCKRLGLTPGPGLLDALGDADIDPESLVMKTDVPHLSILSAGTKTTSDTELLASSRTRDVVARLLANNPRRFIVFDSPPALAASPAGVLAMLVGQVVLIVRADRTPESEVQAAVAVLDGCDEIALLLNAVTYVPDRHRFGSYYYYSQEKAR